jgi:hypothetical protein
MVHYDRHFPLTGIDVSILIYLFQRSDNSIQIIFLLDLLSYAAIGFLQCNAVFNFTDECWKIDIKVFRADVAKIAGQRFG